MNTVQEIFHQTAGSVGSDRGTLVLDDGTTFTGISFGAQSAMRGEVVFTTAMVGYPESLTDPSYKGQILVLTTPLVGNYGVPSPSVVDEFGLPIHFESDKIQIAGLIIQDYSHDYSHWQAVCSLGQWLASSGVPGLYNIDTRQLTKKLRQGSRLGKFVFSEQDNAIDFYSPNDINIVAQVTTQQTKEYGNPSHPKVIMLDCGQKYSILRCLLRQNLCVKVVPFDYDFTEEHYDGLFISNGPGDARKCTKTIQHIQKAYENNAPIFGICLGNQLMGAAAGAEIYKMPFGNRGHNQPCINQITGKCYITSQNHGFAVRTETLPDEWAPLFINANDGSNEGIYHKTKPFFSVQFHPEARGGPLDTLDMFEQFSSYIYAYKSKQTITIPTPAPFITERLNVKKVIVLGSGGLTIGQAGEFDYSGSQCIKALREEGVETILINPNIATVQTYKGLADKVYFVAVTPEEVERVIAKERPDGILLSFGGQTGLNCGVQLYERGILQQYGVRVLGTPVSVIVDTEDRDRFNIRMREIDEKIATSCAVNTIDQALVAANKIGYPVIARAAFALGGLGSGFANNDQELLALAQIAFSSSPQLLIERSVKGWKEVEYEVVRDSYDNCIVVCNMENFDPVGVHTGESIVVCPSQTLSNEEYHMLRSTAIKVIRHLGIVGECNIQYALDPNSLEYVIIEVNARLSRSSALASKATGYPLAFVAAKLALGIDLPSVCNSVTKKTTACFEPSLDYCVVKMPRWDLSKFHQVSREIGSAMKSVGEVMAIGRSFEETIQKAMRMVNTSYTGFDAPKPGQYYSVLDKELSRPTDKRIFAVADALQNHDYSVEQLNQMTGIDKWFLYKLKNISDTRRNLLASSSIDQISRDLMLQAKQRGFSDSQIATYVGSNELQVRHTRQQLGIRPVVKQIDTTAAEYPAFTNYLFTTYVHSMTDSNSDVEFNENGVIVLGSGVYRIGSSVEFDWSSVMCARILRQLGHKTIMINYNPETVSTDYDESDRLYFEELSMERVMDIYELEASAGVIVSMGGQQPNNIALPLKKNGVKVLGTDPSDIDKAENRELFSKLLDNITVDQPQWSSLSTVEEAQAFANRVQYPVLVRPSYVLSGAAMNIAHSESELNHYLQQATTVSPDHPVVISKFISGAREIEIDGVGMNGKMVAHAVSEHIEDAGVHSGDAHLVLPPHTLSQQVIDKVVQSATKIVQHLNITGPFNMQFLEKEGNIKVIECNVRASRSFPFVSKTLDTNFVRLATKAIMMDNVNQVLKGEQVIKQGDINHVAVKVPMFSFKRLEGSDPVLGVEMASTGEVACFGRTYEEAFLKSKLGGGFKMPKRRHVLLSSAPKDKQAFAMFASAVEATAQNGYTIYTTKAISDALHATGSFSVDTGAIQIVELTDALISKIGPEIDMVVDVHSEESKDITHYNIRRRAVNFEVSLFNDYCIFDAYAKATRSQAQGGILATEHYAEYW
jgi:carbamoyl-phosphate synthase large subunit/carbamoyl-phosphate synthase small subunit